jgi:hypothetical protein
VPDAWSIPSSEFRSIKILVTYFAAELLAAVFNPVNCISFSSEPENNENPKRFQAKLHFFDLVGYAAIDFFLYSKMSFTCMYENNLWSQNPTSLLGCMFYCLSIVIVVKSSSSFVIFLASTLDYSATPPRHTLNISFSPSVYLWGLQDRHILQF